MDQINILVTDDEREIADLIEIYLVSDGYRVWKAYSAKEGLQILQEHDIQLAILDIMMPEMDGYALAERIRELSRKDSGTVRIVALTASSVTVTEEKVLACGINEILDKPFDVKKFNQLIRG